MWVVEDVAGGGGGGGIAFTIFLFGKEVVVDGRLICLFSKGGKGSTLLLGFELSLLSSLGLWIFFGAVLGGGGGGGGGV